VRSVQSDGSGAFNDAGSTLPVLGDAHSALATVVDLDAGRVVLLADASPLQNHLLAQADNAAFGLAIAGPASRPVSFEEAVHGYGQRQGLAALPVRWKWALAGLVLAALLIVAARFRRLGPPEPTPEPPQPPRRAHVDALASALARTGTPDEALRPVQDQARMVLLSRAHLSATAGDPDILTAAERFGLDDAEARAILAPGLSEADAVPAGRALAKLTGSAT
jgi:hypothetical protein